MAMASVPDVLVVVVICWRYGGAIIIDQLDIVQTAGPLVLPQISAFKNDLKWKLIFIINPCIY
jgi:hypothetical protein